MTVAYLGQADPQAERDLLAWASQGMDEYEAMVAQEEKAEVFATSGPNLDRRERACARMAREDDPNELIFDRYRPIGGWQ